MHTHRILFAVVITCGLSIGACHRGSPRQTGAEPPTTSYRVETFDSAENEASRKIRGAFVTPGFFQTAGVQPLLGRIFVPEEYRAGRQQVIILSHRFWRQQFNSDPARIGTKLELNNEVFTITGVMPPTFDIPSGADVWVPETNAAG